MTADSTSPLPTTSQFRWWRDWLLCSVFAVYLLSLIAAHLPPPLTKIVIFPIGFGIACGLAIRSCADLAGGAPPRSRRWPRALTVVVLLLAGFAHIYWIVYSRYRDEAREAIADQADERREREQIAAAIAGQGGHLDEAGVAALLQPPPKPPTFRDYLRRRLASDHLPAAIQSDPWPIVVFGLEIAIAVMLGCWFAVEGAHQAGKASGPSSHPPEATTS